MRYIRELHLVNFQSHKDTHILLDPGLNVLVGESDQGKTAVIRALRWLFYNEPRGTGFIRAGETYCEVSVIYDDGTKVSRIRDESKRINRYIVSRPGEEEVVTEKFKNEIPLEVQNILGVFPLWIDRDDGLEVNLARQLEAPFLISASGANRARIIGRIANLHVIDAAQREVLKDIRNTNKSKTDLENEVIRMEEKLKQYDDLQEKQRRIEQLQEKLIQIEKTQKFYENLLIMQAKSTQVRKLLADNESTIKRLNQLEEANIKYSQVQKMAEKLNLMQSLDNELRVKKKELNLYQQRIVRLKGIEQSVRLVRKLQEMNHTYQHLLQLNQKQTNLSLRLERTDKIIKDTSYLEKAEKIIEKLQVMRETGYQLQQIRKAARELAAETGKKTLQLQSEELLIRRMAGLDKAEKIEARLQDGLERLNLMRELYHYYQAACNEYAKAQDHLQQVNKCYKEYVDSYLEVLSSVGRCPTCYSQINEEVIYEIACSLQADNCKENQGG